MKENDGEAAIGTCQPGCECQLHHLLGIWTHFQVLLSLSVLICQTGLTAEPTSWG